MLTLEIPDNTYVQVTKGNRKKLQRLMGVKGFIDESGESFQCKYQRTLYDGSVENLVAPRYSILIKINENLYHMECKDFNTLVAKRE